MTTPPSRDPHAGPVSEEAWAATDMEARCEVERLPESPQRIVRWRPEP